ncbi:hypothetical protein Trydic_g14216 [Trypoxylus dichotomus]
MDPKRKNDSVSASTSNDPKKWKKEVCPHAEKCYRRNPHHFKEYDHPHLSNIMKQGSDFILPNGFPQERNVIIEQINILKSLARPEKEMQVCSSKQPIPKSTMNGRSNSSRPSNQQKKLHPTIYFLHLLCPSLGELKTSLQFNFMIDVMWLMEQYRACGLGKIPLTILYGYEFPDMETYMSRFLPNITYHRVKMKDPFGTHHSKDWNHYNQGLWISPACGRLPEGSTKNDGESSTKFKSTLIQYLQSYNVTCLKEWIERVEMADFSSIKVFLVTSVPGKHYPQKDGSHVHRVTDILSKHCVLPSKTTTQSEGPLAWGINAQASTLGSLGKTPAEWLRSVMLRTLATHKQGQPTGNSHATLNIVYPTVDNVMTSLFGAEGGGCLPYAKNIHEKQKWLKDYLHQWKADVTCRTRVMPHIKTYCRISPCLTKLAWFLLTSANISKAAWGGNIQKDAAVYVRSYEVGVMFMPNLFDEDYFFIDRSSVAEGRYCFPFIYDFPLTPYTQTDYPWCN